MRLGRARHHRRIPLPGRLCCDPARSTSTCCRSHEASAGGPSCACVNRYFHDRADDGHIGLPAAVPSRQSHTREPTVPSGTARKSQIAITASPIRPHQNLQIPITSHLCPASSCLGGFRTPAPCLSLDLRGPASENLHHAGHSAATAHFSKPDMDIGVTRYRSYGRRAGKPPATRPSPTKIAAAGASREGGCLNSCERGRRLAEHLDHRPQGATACQTPLMRPATITPTLGDAYPLKLLQSCNSNVCDISGMPRRISLNRVLPARSS